MNRLVAAAFMNLLVLSPASAQSPDASMPLVIVEPAAMSADGTTGLFRLPAADVIPDRYWSVAMFADNSDWNPGDIDNTQFAVSAAYGVGNSAEVFGRFNFISRLDIDERVPPGTSMPETGLLAATDETFLTGVGDGRVGIKFQFARRARADVLGGVVIPSRTRSVGADRVNVFAGLAAQRTVSSTEIFIASTATFAPGGGVRELKTSGGIEIRRDLRWRPQFEVDLTKVGGSLTKMPFRVDLLAGPAVPVTHDLTIRPAFVSNPAMFPDGTGYQVMVFWHPGRICP